LDPWTLPPNIQEANEAKKEDKHRRIHNPENLALCSMFAHPPFRICDRECGFQKEHRLLSMLGRERCSGNHLALQLHRFPASHGRVVEIVQANSPVEIAMAHELFQEYAAGLGIDLSFQGFDAELAGLPGSYAPPAGRLLLALAKGDAAGCVALRPVAEGCCELKRLFVRPAFRGQGLGKRLAQRLITEGRLIGYTTVRLDTLHTMRAAIQLYESIGFVRCRRYYSTPLPHTVFMELTLQARPKDQDSGP
jgi:GNAT superfamily N-acetyltransferase